MKLIVGLGNPGLEYINTRHNVGFYYLDLFANKINATFKEKFNGMYAKIKYNNQDIRKRIKLMEGKFEKNPENNNSIIIKIEELKEKQIFNFSDNINDTYYFGFEIDVISSWNLLVIILIGICCILFILLVFSLGYICKKNKSSNLTREASFLAINNKDN